MDTIYMNSGNSKKSEPYRLLLNLTDKISLKGSDKYVSLLNLRIYYTQKNSKFEVLAPTWNEKFELPDGVYSASIIQDYFEYITKKHETLTDNPPLRIHVNKIENGIKFEVKTGCYLELLTPETMKLVGSTNSKITWNENKKRANVHYLKNNWSSISLL